MRERGSGMSSGRFPLPGKEEGKRRQTTEARERLRAGGDNHRGKRSNTNKKAPRPQAGRFLVGGGCYRRQRLPVALVQERCYGPETAATVQVLV